MLGSTVQMDDIMRWGTHNCRLQRHFVGQLQETLQAVAMAYSDIDFGTSAIH